MRRIVFVLVAAAALVMVDTPNADARILGRFFNRGSCGKTCDRCGDRYFCRKDQHCCKCGGVNCGKHQPNSVGKVGWNWGRHKKDYVTMQRKDGTKVKVPVRKGAKFTANPAPVPVGGVLAILEGPPTIAPPGEYDLKTGAILGQ